MTLDLDGTFAIQIASFLILWVVLRRLLFDPTLAVLDEREKRTRGSHEAASHMHADVAAMRAEYDQRVRGAREKSVAELEASRKLTAAEERTVLGAARDEAAAHIARARIQVEKQAEAAHATLLRDAGPLADELVEKVAGRSLQ